MATVLLFLSGAGALVFQVLWIRQLTRVVGVDVYAVTIGVSAFFAGLAVGGWLVGRRADRAPRPWRLYGRLELGIALSGAAATLALARAAAPFAWLEGRVDGLAWLPLGALVGLPALLMGGTVPALARAVAPAKGRVGRAGGTLYGANTAGAIVGTLLGPLGLVPWLGVRGAGLAAACLHVAAGATALALDRTVDLRQPAPARHGERDGVAPGARLAIALYAVAGGIALGYEVVWSQAIVPYLSTRSLAFAVMLATYLAGLAVGSAAWGRFADRARRPWLAFGALVLGAGLAAQVAIIGMGERLPSLQGAAQSALLAATGSQSVAMAGRFLLAAAVLVLPATLLLGAAFPAALRVAADAGRVGRDVGAVLALNTAGGIAGICLTGLVLVPRLGLLRSLGALAIAAAAVALVALGRERSCPRPAAGAVLALAIATLAVGVLTPPDLLGRRLAAARGGDLVFYEEGAGGTVAVLEQRASHASFRRLYIQGVSNSGDAMTSLRYMRLQGLLPLIVHRGEPRSALVVGLGTGITCGALLAYPDLDRRLCVELLPAVVRASAAFSGNFGAASDPRIEIRVGDGRRELLRAAERFDLVTLEPPPPSEAGVANLYSRDFYELAASRLAENGLLAQWWPLPTQNDEDSRALVASFLDAFPYASLWTTEVHEMLLLGSKDPLELDVRRIRARFAQPEVSAALREVGVGSAAGLLATWVADRGGLAAYAGDAAPVTDDRPRIEYARWLRPGEFERVLPGVLAIRTEPSLLAAGGGFAAEVARERGILMDFYAARLHALRGDRAAFSAALGRVLETAGDSPYYRWVAGVP
jgi:spermidine synthase